MPTQTAPAGRGRVPLRLTAPFDGYAAEPLDRVCRLLVAELDRVVADGRARDALVRFFGLTGAPQPLSAMAASLRRRDGRRGLSIRRTQALIEDALTALAAALPAPATAPTDSPWTDTERHPTLRALRHRAVDDAWASQLQAALWIARAQSTAALLGDAHGAGRSSLSLPVALAQLESDAFGTPAPPTHHGRRIEPWLRYRLRRAAWAAVCAVDPDLAHPHGTRVPGPDRRGRLHPYEDRALGPRRLALVDGAVAEPFGEALTCEPDDPDTVAWLLALSEQAYRQGSPLVWELVGLARDGLQRAGPPDTEHVARSLLLHATLAAHASDPAALRAARALEHLRGALDPLPLRAYLTVAAAWSAHGYSRQVVRLLRRRLQLLDQRQPGPQRDFYRTFYAVRLAGTLVENRALLPAHIDATSQVVEPLLEDGHALADPAPLPDLFRAWAEVRACQALAATRPADADAAARAAEALLAEAARAFPPPPRLLEDRTTPGVTGHRPALKWHLAELRVRLAAGDADGFVAAQQRVAAAWEREPLVPFLGRAIQATITAGAARLGLTPVEVAPPHPATGWSAGFRPPPTALPPAEAVRVSAHGG